MADSDNILSILASLGTTGGDTAAPPATNVLQAAAMPVDAPQPAPVPVQAPAAAPAEQPSRRKSLLDIIGGISDVIAKVGGAEPLYQPSLDAAKARITAAADHDLATQKAGIDLATSKFALTDQQRAAADSERKRFGDVLGAVNDAEDAKNLPAMMAAAGLTDPRYTPFVNMIQSHPTSAKTLASALGQGADKNKLGHNLYFGTDKDGKTVAYQIGDDGTPHILDFSGAGVTPGEPLKVVDTGSSNVAIGTSTGKVARILPNTVKPDTVLTTTTSRENNQDTNRTSLAIAGMPARAQAGKTASGKAPDPQQGLRVLDSIEQSFTRLHEMNALPGDGNILNRAENAISSSPIGQAVGSRMGNPAAQERAVLEKNLGSLQSDLLNSLPGSATRTRFEQEIQARRLPNPATMSYSSAMRVIQQYREAYQSALKSAPSTGSAPVPSAAASNIPMLSPADAAKLPPGSTFRTLDGRVMVRH